MGFHIQYPAVFQFLLEQVTALVPYLARFFRGIFQKTIVPFIQGIVFLNEVAHIHFFLPDSRAEPSPSRFTFHTENNLLVVMFIHQNMFFAIFLLVYGPWRAFPPAGTESPWCDIYSRPVCGTATARLWSH